MRNPILTSTLLFIIPFMGFTQDKSTLRFSDISIITGVENYFDHNGFSDDFLLNEIAGSELIPDSFDYYSQGAYYSSHGSTNFALAAGFVIGPNDENAKIHKRLRIGLSYSQPVLLSSDYYYNDFAVYDTLTSSRTGDEFYVDSNYYSNLGIYYEADKISLNTSLLWTTDDASRFSFYGGVNLSLSVFVSARVRAYRSDFSYISGSHYSSPRYYNGSDYSPTKTQSFKQSSSFGFAVSSPVGIDWRLGRPNKGLNDVHIFAEVRPGVGFNNIPNYQMKSQFMGSAHLGLRFSM